MLNNRIKVLLYTDPLAFQVFGGAEFQMIKTKEYLEKISSDVLVKFFNPYKDKINDFDILHVFHMRSECLPLCQLAKDEGLKIVLSPIFWPVKDRDQYFSLTRALSYASVAYSNYKNFSYFTGQNLFPYKNFLELADVVLPTSKLEADLLSVKFRTASARFFPVPVGVEKCFLEARPDSFVRKYGLRDFVLFVGRIEYVKNVLTLLKALKMTEIPLVIVGHINPLDKNYYLACEKVIKKNSNFHYLGFLPVCSEELMAAYAAAKVFVLPSWYEVTSLTSLEAGLAGCNLVITKNSYLPEYFGNRVLYVNPDSVEDVKNKILKAYNSQKNDDLRLHIRSNYTWEHTAKGTLAAYDLVLK